MTCQVTKRNVEGTPGETGDLEFPTVPVEVLKRSLLVSPSKAPLANQVLPACLMATVLSAEVIRTVLINLELANLNRSTATTDKNNLNSNTRDNAETKYFKGSVTVLEM